MRTGPAVPGTGVAGGDVSVALGDGIGTITFSHPKSNSLPAALLRRLAEAITWVGKDPAARPSLPPPTWALPTSIPHPPPNPLARPLPERNSTAHTPPPQAH